MKKAFYPIITLSIALILRLYPTLLSGLPFSTDAWSPIKNAELLMKYTPIPLNNDTIFDGYNNYWPANSIFGLILSYTTGLKIINTMALAIPIAGAITILIFYTLVEKITKNTQLAFLSSLLLATAYPLTLFTAGVTKETYANPLYILTILLFLHNKTDNKKLNNTLLFTITSIALVTAHHLTTLITISILTNMTIATEIFRIKKGYELDKSSILYTTILLIITITYFNLYANKGLKITITPNDILSITSYQIIALTLTLYLTLKPPSNSLKRTTYLSLLSTFITLSIFLLTTERPITPEAPKLPNYYILYASPFIITSPLIVLGHGTIQNTKDEKHTPILFWLATLIGLESYAIFGNNPLGLTLAYRTLNFLLPPLIIILTLGLHRLSNNQKHTKITKPITALIILTITTLNTYNLYASTILQERYLGYFWLYTQPEYAASKWIATTTNQTITTDIKISYLLNYFNTQTNPIQGLQYLIENTDIKHIIFLTYNQMLKNGYVLYGGYSIDLPNNWTEKLNKLNLVYSNNQIKIYQR